jgi:predicted ATP-grasp superfamily ATP-dependent carboligase
MDKVLLLDTNFSSAPIYQYLIKENFEVFVIGDNPNDYLAKISPNYCNFNYSNINLVDDFIKEKGIKYLVPGCNDFSYKICSQLTLKNHFLGIENPEINDIINNKEKFRKFSLENDISIPRVFQWNDIPENSKFIVKPVDSFSGNGISVLETSDIEVIDSAIKRAQIASKSKCFLIEEFVEGQLYSHSAFIVNQEIYKDFIVEEHCIANPFAVDTSWVDNNFCPQNLKEIRNQVNTIARKLNLKDGLLHTQFIQSNSKLWIIEVTRRCPGDLYSLLIEKSTSFRYAEEYCKHFLQNKNFDNQVSISKNDIIRHTITSIEQQDFSTLEFNYSIHINEYLPISTYGSKLMPAPKGRVGLLFINTNISESEKIRKLLITRKLYNIKPTF